MSSPTITTVHLEADVVPLAVRRIVETVITRAQALQYVSESALEAIDSTEFIAGPEELRGRASRLRSAISYAVTLEIEMLVQVGRLEQLADIREANVIDRE